MRHPLPALDEGIYKELVGYLRPASVSPVPLEIGILPSTLATSIQYSAADSAIGIPEPLLVNCFLVAHFQFFGSQHVTGSLCSRKADRGAEDDNHEGAARVKAKACGGEQDAQSAWKKYEASTVMLLWDPNHTTAINYRKRYILSHTTQSSQPGVGIGNEPSAALGTDDLVQSELHLLGSLLTSPMRRHNKSSTLFTHRLWLLRNFILPQHACSQQSDVRGGSDSLTEWRTKLWLSELELVMAAGDRHAANYYAWSYARDVVELLGEGTMHDRNVTFGEAVMVESVERVKGWCFGHPGDVSGWSFLAWLMVRVPSLDGETAVIDHVRRTYEEVQGWKANLQWKGAALDAFIVEVAQSGRAHGNVL